MTISFPRAFNTSAGTRYKTCECICVRQELRDKRGVCLRVKIYVFTPNPDFFKFRE